MGGRITQEDFVNPHRTSLATNELSDRRPLSDEEGDMPEVIDIGEEADGAEVVGLGACAQEDVDKALTLGSVGEAVRHHGVLRSPQLASVRRGEGTPELVSLEARREGASTRTMLPSVGRGQASA
ncbi:unnamed protein product [Ilex paraguariensis]|uniref:Uncharacterized protein n=1 Tax=Ilex paraguariensis TaxID=185542 RepID=A0ABC8TF25_9AQUA